MLISCSSILPPCPSPVRRSHGRSIAGALIHGGSGIDLKALNNRRILRIRKKTLLCYADESTKGPVTNSRSADDSNSTAIQLYSQIERLMTETAKQSQDGWRNSGDWSEVEGAWVLKPRNMKPTSVIHFIGGIFVGAAPQLTYRFFLERLSEKGALVIATPFASGFDHFLIADEVQSKYDRCFRFLKDTVNDLPTFGVGHSLGSCIHLLIGSRYAIQRTGNVLMAFNNKEASSAIPLFSPVIVPMAQSFGPLLSQLTSSPTIIRGAEIAMKQLENLSPPIMKQVLPLVEQLPPLYTDLVKGREDFTPKPEEARRLVKSYYGVPRNLLIKFKDDTIDETPTLAQVLSVESAISSSLDMSIRSLPGDHGLPLQQILPDVPPAMADAVNRGGEILANLTVGTPWESVAKEVGNTFGSNSGILRAQISKEVNNLVDEIVSWMDTNSSPKLLRP
ncbi:alpha/beta-Hydrolases protein [Dioscorea alata]|uniref:Alpha/beta-Hydrolases protein n=1 Tax=Dioscorea alata TaxID=55571 RepID=A0ACB7UTC5_DIOAL|nr:alpha/beta-Hydrolases protein [Dioscorea alata]